MSIRRLFLPGLFVALIVPLIPGQVAAAGPTVDRGLPTSGINEPDQADRSNIAWSNGNNFVSGDSFSIGESGQTYTIDSIRTWSTAGANDDEDLQLGDLFKDVTLYFGTGAISPIASGTLAKNSSVNSNPDITHTKVTYPNGEGYLKSDTTFGQVWEHDFTNLNLEVEGGTTYYFAVDGTARDKDTTAWSNLASNAELAGSPQDGSNGLWNAWKKSDLTKVFNCDSEGAFSGKCSGGWDKTSDISVQVFADLVPPVPAGVANPPTPCVAGDYSTSRASEITFDSAHTHLWCTLHSSVRPAEGVTVGSQCVYGNRRMTVIQFTAYANGTALLQCL